VVGLDFAQPSVDWLKKQFPDSLIVQADLSASSLPLPEESRYKVISAFDVLLHIVDPDGFRRAIANLARHCAPGGWLIISDAIVCGQGYVPTRLYQPHNMVRLLADYEEVLEANGFAIQGIRPVTVLLNTPLEASSSRTFRAFQLFWRIAGFWGRSSLLCRLLGPAMMMAERLACRIYPGSAAPGAKMIFARKLV
jgi:SAM-dependent methyltransferase